MPTIGDLEITPPHILLYGKPGAGKSALLQTLGDKVQILDFDDGVITGKTLKDKWFETRKKANFIDLVERNPRNTTIFAKTEDIVQKTLEDCIKGTFPYEAFVLDSFTTLADHAMLYTLHKDGKSINANPEIQHWGRTFNRLNALLLDLFALPITVILVCHEKQGLDTHEIKDDRQVEICISGTKFPSQVCSKFGEIWRCKAPRTTGKKYYEIQTMADYLTTCRTRLNVPNNLDMDLGLKHILSLGGFNFKGN